MESGVSLHVRDGVLRSVRSFIYGNSGLQRLSVQDSINGACHVIMSHSNKRLTRSFHRKKRKNRNMKYIPRHDRRSSRTHEPTPDVSTTTRSYGRYGRSSTETRPFLWLVGILTTPTHHTHHPNQISQYPHAQMFLPSIRTWTVHLSLILPVVSTFLIQTETWATTIISQPYSTLA